MDDADRLGLPASFMARNMEGPQPVMTAKPIFSATSSATKRNRSFETLSVSQSTASTPKSGKSSTSSIGSLTKQRSRSLTNLSLVEPRKPTTSAIEISSERSGVLRGILRHSRSLPQLSSASKHNSFNSLTSIPEGENENEDEVDVNRAETVRTPTDIERPMRAQSPSNSEPEEKNLKWGGVEEYIPTDDTESRASSTKTDEVESSEDEEEEEDDGWGWFEQNISSTGAASQNADRRTSRTESLTSESSAKQSKDRKPLVRVLSQSTPLDPIIGDQSSDSRLESSGPSSSSEGNTVKTSTGGSLLLLGSDQWPERRTRKRRDRGSKKSEFFSNSAKSIVSHTVDFSGKNNLLESLVLETRSKGYPIAMSAFLVFSRGAATGFALRAIPSYFLRIAMWFYGENAPSHGGESLRTALFLGLSMSTYHVMAMNNVAREVSKSVSDDVDEPESESKVSLFGKDRWIVVTVALMTPLLGILPPKSRLSMALFVAARATEAVINGLLFRLSRSLREQLPVSKWLFALGSAQVVFTWLFHRSALPTELATFLDKASSVRPDTRLVEIWQSPEKATYDEAYKVVQSIVYPPGGDSVLKKLLLGSGLIELLASDMFSAASLFGPVFAFPHEFSSSLGRGARSAAVLVADAMLSGFTLLGLSRLLRRVAPSNGWWAGFIAGLVAIQGEVLESRRVEVALFALTYAARALYNIAAQRQIFQMPQQEIVDFFNNSFKHAYQVVLSAVAQQVVNYVDTGYSDDGATLAEVTFEECIFLDKGAIVIEPDFYGTEEGVDILIDRFKELGGDHLLPKRDDERRNKAEHADAAEDSKDSQSFRADRRLIRVTIARYYADVAWRKFARANSTS